MKVKLIVTGPFSSGKTEFISRISEIDPITTEKRMTNPDEISKGGKEFTTVAMDFGRITVDEELVLYIFGTPGQDRFRFMTSLLKEGALGAVVLVDSTDERSLAEGKEIADALKREGITYIVAANKQDLPNAIPPEDVREVMGEEHVVPCIAKDKESVKEVILTLLYRILEEMADEES